MAGVILINNCILDLHIMCQINQCLCDRFRFLTPQIHEVVSFYNLGRCLSCTNVFHEPSGSFLR